MWWIGWSCDHSGSIFKCNEVCLPLSKRPRAWPALPVAGQTQPERQWGSWWWSAEHAPVTQPNTPAHYQTPHRRWGAPAAWHRSCTEEGSLVKGWCSWTRSVRERRWGRIRASLKGHWWPRRTNCGQGWTEGRRERTPHPTCWAKSWSAASGHSRAESQGQREWHPKKVFWIIFHLPVHVGCCIWHQQTMDKIIIIIITETPYNEHNLAECIE